MEQAESKPKKGANRILGVSLVLLGSIAVIVNVVLFVPILGIILGVLFIAFGIYVFFELRVSEPGGSTGQSRWGTPLVMLLNRRVLLR